MDNVVATFTKAQGGDSQWYVTMRDHPRSHPRLYGPLPDESAADMLIAELRAVVATVYLSPHLTATPTT